MLRGQLHSARKMPLAQVCDFVGHHRRKLIFRLCVKKEPVVDTHHATGYRERVDGRIVDDDQFDTPILQVTVLC